MRASLFAMATTTTFLGALASSAIQPGSDGGSISLDPQAQLLVRLDQDLAQIDVAALADAEQLRLASGGILSWHDSEPCCEVSPLMEGSSVADSRDDGCCYDRSDAWDLTDASAPRVCSGDPLQLRGEFFDLLFDCLPLTPQHVDEIAHLWCQVCFRVLEDVRHGGLQLRWRLRKHHPSFEQEGPQLVDDGRAPRDQPIAHSMNRLKVQLIVRLDRNKAHVLAFDGLCDRFASTKSFLLDFTNGFTN